jgi:hypothetical protein
VCLLSAPAGVKIALFLDPENGIEMFLWNVGLSPKYMQRVLFLFFSLFTDVSSTVSSNVKMTESDEFEKKWNISWPI